MAEKLRFGLIGCGSQGRFLSEALRMTGRAELVACADPSADAAQVAMTQCGYAGAYGSAGEMLEAAEVDAVIIATIHDQLQPMAMAAVAAGKHVFVEKPMALCAADGLALVDAAAAADVRLMVGYTLRFMPDRILMKQLIREGLVGDITHVSTGQCIGPVGGWLNDPAHGGGPMFYIGSHALDCAMWMADAVPLRVFAAVHRPDPRGCEQSVDAVISCEGGFSIQLCTSYRVGCRYGWLDVMGTHGRLRAEWESNVLLVWSNKSDAYSAPTRIEVPNQPYIPPVPSAGTGSVAAARYLPMWLAEMHEFCEAISEGRTPRVCGEDGLRLLRVADAIFASGRAGEPVDVG